MDKRFGPRPEWLRKKISKTTKQGMAAPEVKFKLVALKGNGNGFKAGKLNPMFGLKDEKHPVWKGDKAGYCALHMWVVSKKGKPIKCSQCGKEKINKNGYRGIDWANKDHKYKRILTDYIALCKKCHTAYDYAKFNRKVGGKYPEA